mgnify:CR=1 FL=1|tara:strand:+ start:171 stop:566 length:396 start_codon:yes stop_codon:yes gene_type:complete
MKTSCLHTFPKSPFYIKALEIFMLSRGIASYLIEDITFKDSHNYEDPSLYVTGDMVQQSISLAPEILMAEQHLFQEDKHKHIESVDRLASLLYINCERLEKTHSNGKDFLPILRKELKKFRTLQHSWMLTL